MASSSKSFYSKCRNYLKLIVSEFWRPFFDKKKMQTIYVSRTVRCSPYIYSYTASKFIFLTYFAFHALLSHFNLFFSLSFHSLLSHWIIIFPYAYWFSYFALFVSFSILIVVVVLTYSTSTFHDCILFIMIFSSSLVGFSPHYLIPLCAH